MTRAADVEEAALLRALWEQTPHMVMLLDAEGRIVIASSALGRVLGYAKRLSGLHIAELALEAAGAAWAKRDAAPEVSRGQLVQLASHAGPPVLMQVTHVFSLAWQGQPCQAIALQPAMEAGRESLRQQELDAMSAIASAVCEARDLDSTVQFALDKVSELLDMEVAVVALLDGEGTVRIAAHRGIERETLEKYVRVEVGKGVMGIPLLTGQPLLVPDLDTSDLMTDARAFGCRSIATMPLIVRREVLGSIAVASRKPKEFPHGAEDLLRMMGLQIGIAVDNARLLEREALRARQLEAAVQELHHRVKNNLETLSAVLELARGQEGAVGLVDRLLERVGAMAAVHGLLREGRWGEEADAAELVNQVVTLIGDSCGHAERNVRIAVNAGPCVLPAHQATSLALVTGELVSNALRHAFTEEGGEVSVRFGCRDGEAQLVVADNGKGMPPCFDSAGARPMGLQIVRALVEHSLGGRLEIRSSGGTQISVSFAPQPRNADCHSDQPHPERLGRGRPLGLS